MKYQKSILALALAAAAGSAQAWGLGARIGTTGVGADFGFGIAPTLGGRIGFGAGQTTVDAETDDVNYDAKVKVQTVNLFLDWSPLGPFRITAGFIPNNNKVDLNGTPKTGTAFIPAGSSLTGRVEPERDFAPYLGIGYGNVWTKGIGFYADAGVMFQGSPKVSLTLNCGPTTPPAQCSAAQSQVEAERQRVEDEIKRFKYYPVVNIGLTFGW